ncbi:MULTISPECIES: GNAT family N-acetyltransferase [Aerococcus]|uniref:N-acetyltransferase n=1 Tax=Aerococcus urinae TaxID=1376 RepID=A0A2I1L679_9LACT|nr:MULTISPECIES: GNAT family protein [Aerococcus]KAA9219200.1 GNAT family N-acetyltransferase [Aerococcus loyolae]KAA9266667.1 GNAT family N-acetyltransferase [Aerococcus loyolae]MCY3067781.1 GNAT family N-acetyltransferase [Aerococcus mictus]MCY3080319.1 GNAT family N-acetyltransferase [Aerococcus mictus]MCY3084099.1 GNAT family N-acetyltransferase [Aerococcus mictus]
MRLNRFNQTIGDEIEDEEIEEIPVIHCLNGNTVQIEKLNYSKHSEDLYPLLGPSSPLELWTYQSKLPPKNLAAYEHRLRKMEESDDPYYLVIVDKESRNADGSFALQSIDSKNFAIEVGHVFYSKNLQKTIQATEAQFLLAQYVFEKLKYRRYVWKCDSLNKASWHAAERLGFKYEGTFRQEKIYKGRNRDTAWFSMLDSEWPLNKKRILKWLSPENFDEGGKQIHSLSSM